MTPSTRKAKKKERFFITVTLYDDVTDTRVLHAVESPKSYSAALAKLKKIKAVLKK